MYTRLLLKYQLNTMLLLKHQYTYTQGYYTNTNIDKHEVITQTSIYVYTRLLLKHQCYNNRHNIINENRNTLK